MNYNIRKYQSSDYDMICSWWKANKMPYPAKDFLPSTTYVLCNEAGLPWVSVALIVTNTSYIAWLELLIANPELTKEGRKQACAALLTHMIHVAKDLGYKNLLCLAPNKPLERYYNDLGFKTELPNSSMLVMQLNKGDVCHQ